MPEDYLIQEFHDAGIWLPEELKALEHQRKLEQGFAYQVQALRNPPIEFSLMSRFKR